jgi:hypothetical protein
MQLFLLLTLISSPCDVKFSSFKTDETVFPSVGNRHRETSVAFSFTDRQIFVGFIVILGVGRSSSPDSDDADDMLPRLKSETGIVSSFFCWLFGAGMDGACSTGRPETLLGANSVSGMTFGLYG